MTIGNLANDKMSANKFCHHVAFVVIVFFFSSFTAPFASAMKTAMKTAVNTNIDASPVHPGKNLNLNYNLKKPFKK